MELSVEGGVGVIVKVVGSMGSEMLPKDLDKQDDFARANLFEVANSGDFVRQPRISSKRAGSAEYKYDHGIVRFGQAK